MSTLRVILWDHLSHGVSSLKDVTKGDTLLFCETMDEASEVPHHPKKLAFLYSAMRHFAQECREKGFEVRYVTLDDAANTGSLSGEITRAVHALSPDRLIITQPSEFHVHERIKALSRDLKIPLEIREDERFLCTLPMFIKWARKKRELRMEYFYRDMRKHHGVLMAEGGKPMGGQWNFDKENRKPPLKGLKSPGRLRHPRSEILKGVLALIEERFSHHFGDLEPFYYALTHAQAKAELDDFIQNCLPFFGDYQDAMVTDEPYLFHSLLSSYLNAGLLTPREIVEAAQKAYHTHHAPINAVEGFIRQILGWREYVRGLYWLKMPDYAGLNFLNATRPLPNFYWGAPTRMACVKEAVKHTRVHAYSHHIQRLMVTGNFALLAGLDVTEVQAWYLAVYSDAFEWVEMPNTLGMSLYGDGGIVGSKPYAASGKYIDRMSNFCERCPYKPDELLGEGACPFNSLYWDFLARNRKLLDNNPRLSFAYKNWDRFGEDKKKAIRHKAQSILDKMGSGDDTCPGV